MFTFKCFIQIVLILSTVNCDDSTTWDSYDISSEFQSGIPNSVKVATKPKSLSVNVDQSTFSVPSSEQLKSNKNEQSDDYNDSDLIVIPDPMAVESLLKPVDDKVFSVSRSFMEGKPNGHLVESEKMVGQKVANETIKINGKGSTIKPTIKPKLVTSRSGLIRFNSKDRVEKVQSQQSSVKLTKPTTINNKRKQQQQQQQQRPMLFGQSSIGNNLQVNQPIKRASYGLIGSTLSPGARIKNDHKEKLKKKKINEIKSTDRRMLGPLRLMSQESYLSPTAQFSPFSPSTGQQQLTNQLFQTNQLPMSPSISYLSPSPPTAIQSPSISLLNSIASPSISTGLNPLNFFQQNQQGSTSSSLGLQSNTNQFTGSTNQFNTIPMANVQSIGQLSSPATFQTILPSSSTLLTNGQSLTTNQGLLSSPTFQQSPIQQIQSSSPGLIQIQTPNVQSSPNIQTIPIIQNVPMIQSSPGLASPMKPSISLASPPTLATNSMLTSNIGSPLRSTNFIRTPIGLRSQLTRTSSYFNPSIPTRSRTVYTQTQLVPTHTTVYTTTQFSPATRTTVYETDHVPIYGSSDSSISTKSSGYGSSIGSLSKYGTSFY
ncbi:uncharacterized protein LOC128388455 isoform X2 [Panonychus citri]|uniref:uncharacterized protein LOC128388455 isoform X2 n=1 Tax=Panonychus citri TaxID=50023 RepID=UPI002307121E|nr:uncharacterized protein LOC128388455 isoform X2 [Panonychus citri]